MWVCIIWRLGQTVLTAEFSKRLKWGILFVQTHNNILWSRPQGNGLESALSNEKHFWPWRCLESASSTMLKAMPGKIWLVLDRIVSKKKEFKWWMWTGNTCTHMCEWLLKAELLTSKAGACYLPAPASKDWSWVLIAPELEIHGMSWTTLLIKGHETGWL